MILYFNYNGFYNPYQQAPDRTVEHLRKSRWAAKMLGW